MGEAHLAFTRFTNSRFVGTAKPFGSGNCIRHSYEWDMADYTPSSLGAARVQITYPDGAINTFTKISPTEWRSRIAVSDILYQNGDQFTLQIKTGWQYHFATIQAGGSHYYQMQSFVDSHQNLYTLNYDGGNRVTQVTEPAGRSLKLIYGVITTTKRAQAKMATVTSAPPSGQWLQISIAQPKAYRYLSFVGATPCEIAGIQFLDANGNVISGTPFGTTGSTPTTGVGNVFDGDPTTYFESSDATGGFVGIDQGRGTAVAVASVRILARASYEAR